MNYPTKLRHTLKMTALAGIALLAASPFSAIAAEGEDVELNFGVYTSNKPTAMVREFKPTLNQLEESMSRKLGRNVDIRMQIAKDYDEGVAALIDGKVDFSRFGPSSYIEAKKKSDSLQLLAMESKDGEKVFYGIIAVHKDSPIKSVQELKGHNFAFGDESSTIGRYLSQLYLYDHGVLARDLSEYKYLGRHDLVGTAVGAGDYVAGALNESTFKKLVASGVEIRELARFPNVTKPWIARKGLDPDVFAALQESLYELTDPGALKSLKADGFLAGTDEDYETIRTSMDNNALFFAKTAAEPTMGAAKADEGHSVPVVTNIGENSIQINISFDNPEDARAFTEGRGQPIVVNVRVPSRQADAVTAN